MQKSRVMMNSKMPAANHDFCNNFVIGDCTGILAILDEHYLIIKSAPEPQAVPYRISFQ
jgi:hypothetical protein